MPEVKPPKKLPKKKIGRPATGQKLGKEYVAAYRENLIKAGGATVNVHVCQEAAQALEVIVHADGKTLSTRGAKKAAVEAALISHAQKVSQT